MADVTMPPEAGGYNPVPIVALLTVEPTLAAILVEPAQEHGTVRADPGDQSTRHGRAGRRGRVAARRGVG
jgi:hypothetical protein